MKDCAEIPAIFHSSYEEERLFSKIIERELPISCRSRFPMDEIIILGNNNSFNNLLFVCFKFFFFFQRSKLASRGSILLYPRWIIRIVPPRTKVTSARLHRRNKSRGTYIIPRWARGRATMSSSEKVTEKPRENDKPPAYPVTRRRVTHFFFFFLSFFFSPSSFCISSLHRRCAHHPALDSSPSASHPRFHRFPPSTIFRLSFAEQSKDSKPIEPIITIEYFI